MEQAAPRREPEARDLEARVTMLENIGQLGTWSFDLDSGIVELSPWLRELTGLGRPSTLGAPLTMDDFVANACDAHDVEAITEIMSTAVVERMGFTTTHRIRTQAGPAMWVRQTGEPVMDADERVVGFMGVTQRIDEQVRQREERAVFEETLQRVQRDESTSYLASGLAHEVSNLLQPALMMCELTRMAIDEGETVDLGETLGRLSDTIQRTADVVSSTLEFARLESEQLADVAVDAIIDDLRTFLDARLLARTRFLVDPKVQDRSIEATRAGIVQVAMNLLKNSAAASSDDTPITLGFVLTEVDGREQVEIEVRDKGPGFSDEALVRAFDPLFTTKFGSKGTGLGLAVVRTMVERWGGTVDVSNPTDGGALVAITLPAVETA